MLKNVKVQQRNPNQSVQDCNQLFNMNKVLCIYSTQFLTNESQHDKFFKNVNPMIDSVS